MNLPPEYERLRLLELDTYEPERIENAAAFAAVLKLVTEIAGVRSAAVNLILAAEQVTAAVRNWDLPARCGREVSFCNTIVVNDEPFEVEDATLDARFRNNPLVDRLDGLRFYAGFPLRSPSGFALGALCLSDPLPGRLTPQQRAQIDGLAIIAETLLEAHRTERQRQRIASIMQVQSTVLQQAAMGDPLADLANSLIRGMESCIANTRASMTIVTEDKKRLRWIAGPSLPESFASACSNVAIDSTVSPCAMAAHTRQQVMSADIGADAATDHLRPLLQRFGIQSYWSIPLLAAGGELIGTFAVYFSDSHLLTASECAQFEMLSDTAAIIIERDFALRHLIESELQLKEAQEIARLGAYTVYVDTGRRTGSPITNEILGLPANLTSLSTEQFNTMIHPEDLPRLVEARTQANAEGGPLKTNYRIFRQTDGAVRWISGHGIPVRDVDGRITRYTGVMQDVTEQREAEISLRLYQRAIESSSNGVIIVDALDAQLPITYVNPAFEHLTGYNAREMQGRNCRFLQGTNTSQAGLREIRHALQHHCEGRAVLQNFKKNGDEFWVDLRIAPVRDDQGIVTHYVGFQTDITDRIRYERELAHQAGHDTLTGLANRSLLKDRVDQALIRSQGDAHLALVFIDLDRFKLINDSLGHAAGDLMLKESALRIQQQVREGDTVARMGGDEFVVLLNHVSDRQAAQRRTDDILQALNAPYTIAHHNLLISASAGIAMVPEHGDNTTELLRNADIAMYYAKSSGRSNSQFFSSALSATAAEKLELKESLQTALRQSQFCLHYQPKISASSGELVGFEALVRWNHPRQGLLYPVKFIDAAEEFNLIADLGTWVLQEACRQAVAWQQAGQYHVSVAVNVSASQFRKGTFVDEVIRTLAQSGLEARYLELEITESLVMESPEQFIQILAQLHRLGVTISVDDFGTGYSSLSFIKQFPINFLKIDKSFVHDISTDPSDAAICATIITMAHNLGLLVVAEGVETLEQAAFLRARGCDILQGYLISKPLPPQTAFGPFPLHLAYPAAS